MKNKKRFIPLKNYTGIRKDSTTGKYIARKTINGKLYSESFKTVPEAVRWRNKFHPLLTNTELKSNPDTDSDLLYSSVNICSRPNGVDKRFTVGDVWELYRRQHFPSLEPQSVNGMERFCRNFLVGLLKYKMIEINSELLDAYIMKMVDESKAKKSSRRISFDNDLKMLKSFLNWYRENYDAMFVNPVLKRHKVAGKIRKKYQKSNRKMTLENVQSFLDSFEDQFWRDFAEFHFYMAARVQEVAGVQIDSIDFNHELIRVVDVAIWADKKKFSRLKEIPKNGEERVVHLNGKMKEIVQRRVANQSKISCKFKRPSTGEQLNFLFHIDGQPLSYRQIQYRYNQALKKSGLYPAFQSTHFLRKAMANIVRKEMGLDAAQAAGGWKSRDVVEKIYTDAPNELNKMAVNHIESLVKDKKKPKLKLV